MTSPGVEMVYNDLRQSPEDKRMHRGLLLTNKMKVLLISDPTTDKSSAAMRVGVGNMSDPGNLPGLAHFCEHMLFLGTEKYPDEEEYKRYLSENAGTSNASTSSHATTYFFDVAPTGLQGALDRFAQFFIGPLFTVSATDREVNAVNSENEKNIKIDARRVLQVEKLTYDQNHPYSHFGTGNKTTLMTRPQEQGIDTRQALLDFHARYYSSNIMTLAVLGNESLDELQSLVTGLFADVQNKDVTVEDWVGHPLGQNQVKYQLKIVPVKNIRTLKVQFPLPDFQKHYKIKPGGYYSHLLGHEGPGSVYSQIKKNGWATGLSAGASTLSGFAFFHIKVDLTEHGLEHTSDIITLIFQYVNLLRQHGPQRWIQDERKELKEIKFRFKDKELPRQYTVNSVADLQDYPISEVLGAPYLIEEYNEQVLSNMLEHIRPDNCRILVSAQKFDGQTDLSEPWYGVPYSIEPIDDCLIETWTNCGTHPNLHLPERNEFIATNFDLTPQLDKSCTDTQSADMLGVEEALVYLHQIKDRLSQQPNLYTQFMNIARQYKNKEIEGSELRQQLSGLFSGFPELLPGITKLLPVCHLLIEGQNNGTSGPGIKSIPAPKLINKTEFLELWHRQDDEFLLPKACISIVLQSSEVYKSPKSVNLAAMLERVFLDAINEELYNAELAGLGYDLIMLRNGFKISVDGFSDKLPLLLQSMLEKLIHLKVDSERFVVLKEKYIRGLQNYEAEQPHSHSSYYVDVFLTNKIWTRKEKLSQASNMTVADLEAFIPKLLEKLYLKMLVYGNADKQGAHDYAKLVTTTFERQETSVLPRHLRPYAQAVQIPHGDWYGLTVENAVHPTNALKVYYQIGVDCIPENVMLQLISQVAKQPCFDTLRTKEQLGYIVFSGVTSHYGTLGYYITVQSNRSPQFLETRIENFLQSLHKQLLEMADDVFTKHQMALASRRLEKAKSMRQQHNRYMSEITSEFYFFNRDEREVTFLKALIKDQVIKFFETNIAASGAERRKLSVYIPSATTPNPDNGVEYKAQGDKAAKMHTLEDFSGVKKSLPAYPHPVTIHLPLPTEGTNAELISNL